MKPLKSTAPRTSILHPDRAYVPSGRTDIAATFRKFRKRQAEAEQEAVEKVRQIRVRK